MLSAAVNIENLAKNKQAWGMGLRENDNLLITNGNDNQSVLVKGNSGPGWAFVAVDLGRTKNIGYIRVLMSVCKYIIIYITT